MRLFIAVNFNDKTKSLLIKVRDELRAHSKTGNFSTPENMHLTLAFLGECDMSMISAAKTALEAVSFEPFSIEIDQIGRFRRNGGDIWWAGIKENSTLSGLHERLSDMLLDAGFVLENRKFNPHITLGREVKTKVVPWNITAFGEEVKSIELMKSERIQGKLTYTAIHRKPASL